MSAPLDGVVDGQGPAASLGSGAPPRPAAAALLAGLEQFGIKLGLEATRSLLAALGEPQGKFPSVLVAGTNGKGSTAAFLQSILSAAGYRTGFYTSPHLENVEERLRISGQAGGQAGRQAGGQAHGQAGSHAIASDRLGALVERVISTAQATLGHPPTYFEAVTVAAFLYFAEERIDIAVLEVGMGGRLDATNTAEPILSLVTDIALDHQAHLGTSVEAIAREKAGIFRAGKPALVWTPAPEATATLAAAALEVGAEFESVPATVAAESIAEHGFDGQVVRVKTPHAQYQLTITLLGAHQARNLGLAVRAAERLQTLGWRRLGPGAIMRGAALCRWPGRLEAVALPNGVTVLLDGAHNPAGAAALAEFVSRLGSPFDLLFGALADKDVANMLVPLARHARRVTLTGAPNERAASPADLARLLPGREPAVEPSPGTALTSALHNSAPILLVCGSLYLIGELRPELRRRFGVPAALGIL